MQRKPGPGFLQAQPSVHEGRDLFRQQIVNALAITGKQFVTDVGNLGGPFRRPDGNAVPAIAAPYQPSRPARGLIDRLFRPGDQMPVPVTRGVETQSRQRPAFGVRLPSQFQGLVEPLREPLLEALIRRVQHTWMRLTDNLMRARDVVDGDTAPVGTGGNVFLFFGRCVGTAVQGGEK
ncbi:hypothetical protein D3C85_1101920 [compost metagenome]